MQHSRHPSDYDLESAIELAKELGICDKIFKLQYVRICVNGKTDQAGWRARFFARPWVESPGRHAATRLAVEAFIESITHSEWEYVDRRRKEKADEAGS
ncbi:MAG: hypothetical protein LUO89_11255 [Methanothrix sp.]|nr:hypothetical protein [Methanothrix sp.]